MPPTGFHGLLGLLIASRIDQSREYIRIGLVSGSVFPDLDLLGSILIFIVTGNKDLTLGFHRSITHSLVLLIIFIISMFFLSFISIKIKNIYYPFFLGLAAGVFLHVFLDLFYFDGVSLLWPIQPIGERIFLINFTFQDLPSQYNNLIPKIIATLDGNFELIFYLTLASLAKKYGTDNTLFIKWKFINYSLGTWVKKLTYISYFLIINTIFFLMLSFISIFWLYLDLTKFIIILYFVLTPVILLSGFIPIIMKNTIKNLSTN